MSTFSQNVLLIFIKNPIAGKVKTRLAQTIGPEKALTIYQQLLAITQNITAPLNCDRQVWYSKFIDLNDRWENGSYAKRLQKGADLGERMHHAFQQAFTGGYKKAVIIGSDCAEITQQIIDHAFVALDNHDVVIGPSRDGGYYLLGMHSFLGDLFSGMTWSTPTVYEQTIGRVKESGLSLHQLPTLNDIDTIEDLQASDMS